MKRYQFCTKRMRAWRRCKAEPKWLLIFCWWVVCWLAKGCPDYSKIEWEKRPLNCLDADGRWGVLIALWRTERVKVAIDIRFTWYVDELLNRLREIKNERVSSE